jgi:hypothetical protein
MSKLTARGRWREVEARRERGGSAGAAARCERQRRSASDGGAGGGDVRPRRGTSEVAVLRWRRGASDGGTGAASWRGASNIGVGRRGASEVATEAEAQRQ